jgi:GNAT superfamily N-acetyltransferase
VIYELPRALFDRAAPLFAETWMDGAFIWGAFEAVQDARLFVDHPERPTAAILCRTFEYYVAGSAGARELRRFIVDAPAEVGVFGEMYGYLPTNVPMAQRLLDDHDGRLIVVARRNFRWEAEPTALEALARWQTPVAGVTIEPLDRELAERADRELDQMIGRFWGGYDRFGAGGFGSCALAGEQIASVAYAAAVGGGEANIDIFTAAPFRRRGLAARVCAAFIGHCREHGLVPTWDSDSDNQPSAILARSLGFREDLPFTQLSTPGYAKLTESHGLWSATALDDGITAWRRIEG